MKRRSFLRACATALGVGPVAASSVAEGRETTSPAPAAKAPVVAETVPLRTLGRTGERVSIVGFPGFALQQGSPQAGVTCLRRALEMGINYFDVAPAYGDAEQRMGIGMADIDRDRYFLASKTKKRDKRGSREELERSLKRLKTDHLDLYQLHCLTKREEVEQVFGPDGAMETFRQAKEEGKVRFFGFSAHTTTAALAAMEQFRFHTVMFPINFVEYMTFAFGKQVLAKATQQDVAVVAIKTMSGGAWTGEQKKNRELRPRKWWYQTLEKPSEIDLAIRFTLSLEPVVVGIPPAWLDSANKAFEAGRRFRMITDAEKQTLQQMASQRESVFLSRQNVACNTHPDDPHEGCPGMLA